MSMRGRERKSEAAHKGVDDGEGMASEAGDHKPLTAKLVGAVEVTLAYRKQLAEAVKRSSVKANAYPSQAGVPQQAMRQAFSDSTARAAERGAPTRSVWGRERKRAGGHERPEVSVLKGLAVLEEEGVAVEVGELDGVMLAVLELDGVMLEDGVLEGEGASEGDGIYRFDGRQVSAMPDDAQAGTRL